MSDEPDPPRKNYAFKAAEFERVNEPPGGAIDARDLARIAHPGEGAGGKAAAPAAENEVHAILRANEARSTAAGLNTLKPQPRRRSRRARDYWLVLVPVDAFFAFWAFNSAGDPLILACGVGGLGAFTIGFTWVMWFIVDDY